jgi:curli production assembly/transport component CsgE
MRTFLFAGLLCFSLAAAAAGEEDIDRGNIDRGIVDESRMPSLEQSSGFVVDRTITNFGAEFVRQFAQSWREQAGTAQFDVTITEKPSARWGSLVLVEHDNRPVVRAFLYAGRAGTIGPVATAAAEYVAKQLSDNALAEMLFKDPDLAPSGF